MISLRRKISFHDQVILYVVNENRNLF